MAGKRMNIGLFVSQLDNDFGFSVCKGAIVAAKEIDANLIIFPGRYFEGDYYDRKNSEFWYQYNTLFSYASPQNLDALLVSAGTIGNTVSNDVMKHFLEQYYPLPVITLASEIEGFHSIKFDNRKGLYDTITHLIKVHKCRKIGFVGGTKTNEEAIERFQVYKEVLADNNIEFDDKLVVYGNFSEFSQEFVNTLLNRNPDIEAICFANDQMAIGGYQAVHDRAYTIGKDILVTGFDDSPAAVNLVPNLTTVRADASELGYKAVIMASTIDQYDEIRNVTVDTSLVVRHSCGCTEFDLDDLKKDISNGNFEKMISINERLDTEALNEYLFASYKSSHLIVPLKKSINKFFEMLRVIDLNTNITNELCADIYVAFERVLQLNVLSYVSTDKLFSVLEMFYYKTLMSISSSAIEVQSKISTLFMRFYKTMAIGSVRAKKSHVSDIEKLNYVANNITRDFLIYNVYDENSYGTIINKLKDLNIYSSYIYLFENAISHYQRSHWTPPDHVYLKAYHKENHVEMISANKQKINIMSMFSNVYTSSIKPHVYVLTPLFTNEEQYGIFLCELDDEYFHYITTITVQISTVLKIVKLLKQQDIIQRQLEVSITQIKNNNRKLDMISKSDELTRLYNRRGFFERTKKLLNDSDNYGKKAVIVFADMDNLKKINDQFGHDDGDYALKEISNILKETFRSTDIIGRIGGDEFSAFALLDHGDDAASIRARINKISEKVNKNSEKEYLINMSVGVYEFTCAEGIDIENILAAADDLLYSEKKNKRKTVLKSDLL